MKKTKARKTYPERAKDVPVTQAMLYLVRDELRSDIRSHDHRFDSIDHKFESLEHKMDAKFDRMEASLAEMSARIHRTNLLVEEQNNKNNIVLDGLASLFQRQDRVEKDCGEVRKIVFGKDAL